AGCSFLSRNHFDCVRAAIFLPNDSALVTASDDGTLKLWNLQRPATGKKPSSMDLEPIHTFRGHTEAVLCVAVNSTGSHIFSGSVDNDIRKWAVPDLKVEPYEPLPKDPSGILLTGHSDAVWSLVIHPWAPELASASSDGTVGLWDTEEHVLLKTIAIESTSVPTSLDFIRSDATNVTLAVGTKSGSTFLLDIEGRKKPVILKPWTVATVHVVDLNRDWFQNLRIRWWKVRISCLIHRFLRKEYLLLNPPDERLSRALPRLALRTAILPAKSCGSVPCKHRRRSGDADP
ncbi:unnamed protein product, partial [Cyprideis torosa]